MRTSGLQLWALVVACIFVGSLAAASVSVNNSANQPADAQPTAGTSPRTVIAEVFTAWWCPPCANADPALSRIRDEYPTSTLTMVMYHASGSGEPYYDATVYNPRSSFYGVTGIPSMIVDGGGSGSTGALWQIGAWADKGQNYGAFRQKIDAEKSVSTNIQIAFEGDLTPGTADLTARIYASDPITETNLKTRMVVWEDPLYAMGSNGEPFHRVVARALWESPLTITQGDTVVVSHSFTLKSGWDKNRLGALVFVQSDTKTSWMSGGSTYYNGAILQSAEVRFVKANTLLHTDIGSTPDYSGYLERPIAQANRPFETYNTLEMGDSGTSEIKAALSVNVMEEYGAVIWDTGGETSGTLMPVEKGVISGYLDSANVGGNLFIQGRAIAAELGGADPFLGSYLHGVYSGGTSVAAYVNGMTGDPITGAWDATSLSISGSPSDSIDPGVGAFTPIVYPGMMNAGTRADHDANSRVVYYGANYYGSSDSRKTQMMTNILSWLDGVAGPRVSLITPNGGEEYSPGDTVRVQWKAIDVNITTDGVDLFFTTSLSTPSWTPVVMGEPNDGVYTWIVPSVSTEDCGFKVEVRDGDPMTPNGVGISMGACKIGFPNISITKDVNNPTPQAGEVITYSITLTNSGTLSGYATVTDTLPSGVVFQSEDGGLTGVSGYEMTNTTAYWTVIVPPLSSVTWHILAQVLAGPPGTVVDNTADFYSSSALGGSVQTGSDSASFMIPALQNWQLPLSVGKRFASIPILLSDYRVEVVLATIAGSYSYARQYQATDPISPWKSYEPGRAYNTLTHIRPETGFWIEITSPTTLNLVGARAGTTQIEMQPGWNMVGYPSLAAGFTVAQMKASIALPNIVVEGFDLTSAPYNLWVLPDTYVLKAGEGYWVRVPATCTWHVVG